MNDDPTSLDLLHDIVVPPEVSWWPLASGWYIVFAMIVIGVIAVIYRICRRRQANAYRRAALEELSSVDSVAAISQLLRRTALQAAPRTVIAAQTGSNWPDWLSTAVKEPMPEQCRQQLADGGYSLAEPNLDINDLKAYAAHWIRCHRVSDSHCQTSQPN